MPWKGCRKMDEKLRFVSRFLDREKIAALCREFGIASGRNAGGKQATASTGRDLVDVPATGGLPTRDMLLGRTGP